MSYARRMLSWLFGAGREEALPKLKLIESCPSPLARRNDSWPALPKLQIKQ